MCFSQAAAVGQVLGSLAPAVEWVGKSVTDHLERQSRLDDAREEAELARINAEKELAAYVAKSNVEWDLKWADAAKTSWKDEWLLILWSVPLVGIFIPGLRPHIMEGFEFLKVFTPDAPTMYVTGWAIIFAATFGLKTAVNAMLPQRFATLVTAINNASPDIPQDVMPGIQKTVSQAASGRQS